MKLKGYITELQFSEKMELSIAQLWNGELPKYPETVKLARDVVNYLRSKGLKGDAIHLGNKKYDVSETWKKYGAVSGLPKTDVIIGGYKISLKNRDTGAFILNAGKNEARATFFSVADIYRDRMKPILSETEKYFDSFFTGTPSSLSVKQLKTSGSFPAEAAKAEVMFDKFSDFLKKTFSENTDIRNDFMREAMSGNIKFDRNEASAEYLLSFGKENDYHKIDDDSFLSEMASRVNLRVEWKDNVFFHRKKGPSYTFYSVIRMIVDRAQYECEAYEGHLLTEGILTQIKDKIKTWFVGIWNKIKSWLNESIENIFDFFGIEPELIMDNL